MNAELDKDANLWGMLSHLLGIFTGFIGPLVIWLVKKDQSPFVEDQAKESLNFQINLLVVYVIGGATTFICIGVVILLVAILIAIIMPIIACLQANKGERYRYPLIIRVIK